MTNQLQDPNPPHWDGQFIDGSLIANAQDTPRPARNNLALGHNRSIRALTTGTISSQDICGSLLASKIAPVLSNAYIRNTLNILRLAEGLPINIGNSATQRIRQAANAHGTSMPVTRPKAVEARMQPTSTCLVRRKDDVAYHLAFYQNFLYLTILILPAVVRDPLPVPANIGIQYIVAPAVPGPKFQVVLADSHGPQPKAASLGLQIIQVPINQLFAIAPTIQQNHAPTYPLSSASHLSAPPPTASSGSRARVQHAEDVKRRRQVENYDEEDGDIDTKRTRERQFYVYADPSPMGNVPGPFYALTPQHVQAGWECCE
ncbi:hypothetical protein AC578_1658 [Pseudocercospora eumusae]|uniref:Uncharacterized protein n=1 Tax=Pseudocercospora eumusae TaxID=321146 RepID=A0A139HLU5_9PEZI|nr:hypothetical protein AC578_1658 [Pseudocercospora eumusae]